MRARLRQLSKKDLNSKDLKESLEDCAYHALASDDATEMIMISKRNLINID